MADPDRFCAHCGQARFVEGDRRIAHLLKEFFAGLTSWDSRWWRSLRALLFRPGVLSRDYVRGRRAQWMSPIALFLLANLVYFFAPALSDFELPFGDQVPGRLAVQALAHPERLSESERAAMLRNRGQFHSQFTAPWVEARVAERDRQAKTRNPEAAYTLADYARHYNERKADISKLLIVLHVPIMALALALLLFWRRHYFAEYMVVSLHVFAFTLLLIELGVLPLVWLLRTMQWEAVAGKLFTLVFLLIPLYSAIALKRTFELNAWLATLAGITLTAALLFGNVTLYRALQFAIIFALT